MLHNLTKELGDGLSGTVYLTDENKAVKVFDLSDQKTRTNRVELYTRETEAIKGMQFNHKNVIQYTDF